MARKLALGSLCIITGALMITAGFLFSRTAEGGTGDRAPAVIRLHVVANSDSDEDQALKREVRDAILAAVTPLFTEVTSVAEAQAAIATALPRIEEAVSGVIRQRNKAYAARAEVGRFAFPGKRYGSVFLPAGEYAALKVMIGEARGANWWCVLFPPMCFVDWSAGIVLEPRPGTDGAETVTVSRKQVAALIDEERLASAQVRSRSALLEWVKRRRAP